MLTRWRPARSIFDFNGTLSDDEPILCEIFIQLFAEHGKPLSAQEYFDELAGLSDPEIVRTWLGRGPSRRRRGDRRARRALPRGGRRRLVRARAHARGGPLRRRACAARDLLRRRTRRDRAGRRGRRASRRCCAASSRSDDVVEGKPDPEGYLQGARAASASTRRDVASSSRTPRPESRRRARPASGACSR